MAGVRRAGSSRYLPPGTVTLPIGSSTKAVPVQRGLSSRSSAMPAPCSGSVTMKLASGRRSV